MTRGCAGRSGWCVGPLGDAAREVAPSHGGSSMRGCSRGIKTGAFLTARQVADGPWGACPLACSLMRSSPPATLVNSDRPTGALVIVALGSNLAEPLAAVTLAARAVVGQLGLRAARCSQLWRTRPAEAATGSDFVNAALVGWCEHPPLTTLLRLAAIERAFGRDRAQEGFHGARPLDLDLLAHGSAQLASDQLTLPHPRLHQRAFVLGPLAQIAPDWQHPRLGQTAASLWAACEAAEPGHGCAPIAPSPLEDL